MTLLPRSLARFAGDDTLNVGFDNVAATNRHQNFHPLIIGDPWVIGAP
ncbi:hypothetical protein ACWC2K_05415 [Streptomyces chattanoogensis]